jgi:uncharacterized protein YjiS (DUF1127 family)
MRDALKRKFQFHLWVDRLVFRGEARNMSDRMLADIGLGRLERPRPADPVFFI